MTPEERVAKLEELIVELMAELKEDLPAISKLENWDSPAEAFKNINNVMGLFRAIGSLLMAAQEIMAAIGAGEVDEDELVQAAVNRIDTLIKLPAILEMFDGYAIELLLRAGIGWARKRTVTGSIDPVSENIEVAKEIVLDKYKK